MTVAQHINNHFNKNTTTEITNALITGATAITPAAAITDKLTGELKIENYPLLTKIELSKQELGGLIIIDCPNLKEISVRNNKITDFDIKKAKIDNAGNSVQADKLEDLTVGGNPNLKEISVEY